MEYKELANLRHDVKHFDSKKVPLEDIKEIIRTARLAPSGINIQSWHFVVIDSIEAKNALLTEVKPSNHEQIKTSGGLLVIFSDSHYVDRLKLISERAGKEFDDLETERFTNRYQTYVSNFDAEYLNTYMSTTTGLVTMNLLYAIYDKGYKANVILGFNRSEKINELLKINKKFRPELIVPFGKSEEIGKPSFRLDLEDIMEIR
ncbi:nitroreductase family protein [Lactococcus lactis]|uniref:nitroreductase family protein n=1 Tax=Lactococcus lactis TaxID=1358 RepID=UPI002417F2A5|nr:nitroreductase family protein [Lactococcus lactis]MDG4974935.1 nitroreductase family protein [Lactococcus lactis]